MTGRKAGPKTRQRGRIEELPSGSLRVVVYAGQDALTGKRNYRHEVIPGNSQESWNEAERAKTRILNEVDEQRAPKTKAIVDVLLTRYLENLDVDVSTMNGYVRKNRLHISPLLGKLQVGKLDGETFDSFYKVLRTCRLHCGGKGKFIEHRTKTQHECDKRCKPHVCTGLAKSTIRQIHFILSGALQAAKRWKWITINPLEQSKPPSPPKPKPNPPNAAAAAALINEAFRDLDWGMFVWLSMVTGARRGELCALKFEDLDLDTGILTVARSIGQEGGETWEKDTKDHQQRRIALDEETLVLFRAYKLICEEKAQEFGVRLVLGARIFSNSPDHSTYLKPDSVTQRYGRMCARLGLETHLHELRHYSATELIASGVDVRTVAGRLGHSGGGTTTLRVYAAWFSEADQRAATSLGGRMPTAPVSIDQDGSATTTIEPKLSGPYQKIAADLRGAITCGALAPGTPLPPVVELANRYGVAPATAHRAIAELSASGLVRVSRGKRAVVLAPGEEPAVADVVSIKRKRKVD
ncbi:tyrosine-type recombinase/integrase [Lentzea sp. NPDC092896]|uniref:tyrosine-type recombinase/integrase n=1 Tax=Lentzea sp. NPDC092896 TaxID=3364127 RepID=UPI0037F41B2E